jgi:hypothetical protein
MRVLGKIRPLRGLAAGLSNLSGDLDLKILRPRVFSEDESVTSVAK